MKARILTNKKGGYIIQTKGEHWYSFWSTHYKIVGMMEYRYAVDEVFKTIEEAEKMMVRLLEKDLRDRAFKKELDEFKQKEIATCSTRELIEKYPQYYT